MLASIRRGPFAKPTDVEFIEYMLQKKPKDQERPCFENYSLEHVISFQRRVNAIKSKFMSRNERTPLGRIRDWWDRTESQVRGALHSHILCWFFPRPDPRENIERYEPLDEIPRTAPGLAPRQRPRQQIVKPLEEKEYQEDAIYHQVEMGRVCAEMVRPNVGKKDQWSVDKLRIAGLARAIQSKLYMHSCSPKYCLQDRTSCRFFFPWPHQPQQQYDTNTERVALQRRLQEDDQWVVPHNLYLAMFSPATVNVRRRAHCCNIMHFTSIPISKKHPQSYHYLYLFMYIYFVYKFLES